MSTLTNAPAVPSGTSARRGPRLSGMTWLVWRQHRAAFWTVLAATAVLLAWIAYQRAGMTDHLTGRGGPGSKAEDLAAGFAPYRAQLDYIAVAMAALPILLGVFIGAPLLAADLETGTAKLVAAQSVSPARWLTTKLGASLLVVTVSTALLGIAYDWWWGAAATRGTDIISEWPSGSVFDTTGPVPVALTLFTVVGGVAIGMLLRRGLPAMVVTFGFAVAVQLVWSHFRLDLGSVVTATTPREAGAEIVFPDLPRGAYQLDQSYLTSSGDLLGWSTCSQEASDRAVQDCLEKAEVVGWSVDYLPLSQMAGMQWLGASILLALTAGVVAFILLWGRKRLV
ncbi:ABC transporter permease [Streptomyces albus]|uniref:ABC transporter permease n=1 Tax=Streptomyces albus TaxID=1888 RepID=UPI0004C6EF8B|nr:ABC transporter permease [Streptomyces albus]